MLDQPLPIGYYLKKTDNLLTETIDHIQATFGLNRIQWQLLHSIHTQPRSSRTTIFHLVVEFEPEQVLNRWLNALLEKKLVLEKEGLLLTESGKSLHTACWQKQAAFRQQSMAGVSETDYLQLITTLKTIISNVSALSNH